VENPQDNSHSQNQTSRQWGAHSAILTERLDERRQENKNPKTKANKSSKTSRPTGRKVPTINQTSKRGESNSTRKPYKDTKLKCRNTRNWIRETKGRDRVLSLPIQKLGLSIARVEVIRYILLELK